MNGLALDRAQMERSYGHGIENSSFINIEGLSASQALSQGVTGYILSCILVTIDGVRICNWIYRRLPGRNYK
jgi:hypothetical protein